ncbi:predicted protein [Histoplasma capsulatum var. duboisii H88]|uniref:Predicted protein n=1 Tax=Ajellomyces capsulatus (strain H88) TaxID=544711 RepID=F0USY0_AJEC8|nr:predicted protein [Histoplasma capsulatum var. duboisii H88]
MAPTDKTARGSTCGYHRSEFRQVFSEFNLKFSIPPQNASVSRAPNDAQRTGTAQDGKGQRVMQAGLSQHCPMRGVPWTSSCAANRSLLEKLSRLNRRNERTVPEDQESMQLMEIIPLRRRDFKLYPIIDSY